jgi:hypothetical protein
LDYTITLTPPQDTMIKDPLAQSSRELPPLWWQAMITVFSCFPWLDSHFLSIAIIHNVLNSFTPASSFWTGLLEWCSGKMMFEINIGASYLWRGFNSGQTHSSWCGREATLWLVSMNEGPVLLPIWKVLSWKNEGLVSGFPLFYHYTMHQNLLKFAILSAAGGLLRRGLASVLGQNAGFFMWNHRFRLLNFWFTWTWP